ncbi:MAG TPA: hypothetical protein VKU80_08445 [Planctomycetota bacterium]|nr:hypothetical protein [Planctomycetota bacterium]
MIPGYGVFITPRGDSDEGRIAALCQATGLAPADSRLVLASHIPRRILTSKSAPEAEDLLGSLRAAGFDGFVLSLDLLSRARVPQVNAAEFTPEGIVFRPSGAFRPGQLRLLIHGAFLSGADIERTVTTYPQTLTGIVRRPKAETTHERSSSSERFVHLYGEAHTDVLELRPGRFNFRCLGNEFGISAAMNCDTFIRRLTALSPNVQFDDTLLRYPPPVDDEVVSDRVAGGNPLRVEVVRRKQGNEGSAVRASILLALAILGR